MTPSDQGNELAFRQLVAQAREWARPAADGESVRSDGHPLEGLLAWWGGLRFPDQEPARRE